jgi:hypothetical protein
LLDRTPQSRNIQRLRWPAVAVDQPTTAADPTPNSSEAALRVPDLPVRSSEDGFAVTFVATSGIFRR